MAAIGLFESPKCTKNKGEGGGCAAHITFSSHHLSNLPVFVLPIVSLSSSMLLPIIMIIQLLAFVATECRRSLELEFNLEVSVDLVFELVPCKFSPLLLLGECLVMATSWLLIL